MPLFGSPDYDIAQEHETVPILEQLEVFADLIKACKIRYLGLSNETPWGVSESNDKAQPRIDSCSVHTCFVIVKGKK